ncbi:MAG: hypothetical protein JRG96_05975 [Deltaproteobacteria bacterium]|nr:hypothetical protein [Deltaproteobacteria bacterium]
MSDGPPEAASGEMHDASWRESVRELLQQRAPDPERALALADEVLEAATPEAMKLRAAEKPAELGRLLLALCGVAPFFSRFLVRHGDWLPALLAEDLSQPRSREELARRLDDHLAREAGIDPALALRSFKYFELARITARDCCDDWVPLNESAITFTELSQLADLLLDRALAVAIERVKEQHPPPAQRADDGSVRELGFAVLGLGKLGSEELNFSSDVDLIYVFEAPQSGQAQDHEGTAPTVFFTKVAQELGKLATTSTAEGFLYRVDLDLRPEGAGGTLVVSDEALASYYETWADAWEKAAFMKARPVAGDLELGWRAICAVDPMIYHSAKDYRGLESIRGLKQKIEHARGSGGDGFNVKIDPGGIRDVEFAAQALQLLHGGRITQVRDRSTQGALGKLAEVGLLAPELTVKLLHTYRFLRRIENRIQMEAERQTHRVPKDEAGFRRLARAMGFVEPDGPEVFRESLTQQRTLLRELLASSISESGRERILELFTRANPQLFAFESTRRMVHDLAEHFAREIDTSPDPERALNNLDRFIEAVGSRRFYYELLIDRPELVPRLAKVFASSRYLSDILASHPRLIEPVFEDPNLLLLDKEALRRDLASVVVETASGEGDPLEDRLDALRLFHHRQVVNVGLLDLAAKAGRADCEHALTDIAEVCVEEALALCQEQLATRGSGPPESARSGAFLVIAMGKLASRELSYGSDLDIIFLYDTPATGGAAALEAQEYFARLGQRLISSLQTPTSQGRCYEVDTRLRPSGNQGMLVTSRAAFERYHAESAQAWERQILLRSRAIAGSQALARDFETLRREILSRPLAEDLAGEIHRVRQRMELEIAQESSGHYDFKTGRGGLLDVESIVQYLQLQNAAKHPELLEVERLEVQLRRLADGGLLGEESARSVLEGWAFLQRLSAALRVVENRSISDLNMERGDLDSLARRLGYESASREGSSRRALLTDYLKHTEQIRAVYTKLFAEG